MKIVIAAGIYPPETGGSAYYAASLTDALRKDGHEVRVVTYGALKKLPSGVRHILYTIKLWRTATTSDAMIAFDTFSVGVPTAFVAIISGVPGCLRIGGDFLWEHYAERTRDTLPLPNFYRHRERWNSKERIIFYLQRWAMKRLHVVFSSAWVRDIWSDAYKISKPVYVIENAILPKLESKVPMRRNFIFYSRQIVLKNQELFRRAFAQAKSVVPDIELEEGMVSQTELLERMRECYAVVLPSISDITPNYILDAIRCGKPFLITQYSAYAERFKEFGVVVDPLSVDDMARGVRELADREKYNRLVDKIQSFKEEHSYEDIAREFVAIFQL